MKNSGEPQKSIKKTGTGKKGGGKVFHNLLKVMSRGGVEDLKRYKIGKKKE